MEPRIQYAKTSDGVSIGFCTLGEGPGLLIVPALPFSHAQLEWQTFAEFYRELAQDFRVTWYDARGTGVSNRDNVDFSMDAMVRDVEAVADRADMREMVVAGFTNGALVAVTLASRWPGRVRQLVLVNGYVEFADIRNAPQTQAESLIESNWDMYLEASARVFVGYEEPKYLDYMRMCIEQETARAARQAIRQWSIAPILSQIRVGTLVFLTPDSRVIPQDAGRRLAEAIPGAILKIEEDRSYRSLPQVIKEFVGTPTKNIGAVSGLPGRLSTLLFTDLVGHSEMMSRLGDARGRDVLREHERITREVLKAHGGTEIKTMGDGFMASFGSVTKAVECAIALQRAFAGRKGEPLAVRVGLNAGEPIEEEGDLFGATVILASRIAAKAEGCEILVADTVRGLCSGKGFLFADRGEFVAKGFEEPVRLYEVRWREEA